MPERSDPDFLNQQQGMFTSIARRYDLMNHIMSGWQDNFWRHYTINQIALPLSGRILDIGAGTGQLALEASRQYPSSQVIAADLTLPMMELGRSRNHKADLKWVGSETSRLPFQSNSFDAVISAFLVRNLSDVNQSLKEQYRVLKPGGKIAIMDTTKRAPDLFTPLIHLYMARLIPSLAGLVVGDREAYTYLYESTMSFLRAEELVVYLAAVGFKKVLYKRFMFGMIAVHWGEK
jgi:demethylmenaquinone methyltransferase/2-methoxy-6-polyprenyl-1,4-benzoquinol methylase